MSAVCRAGTLVVLWMAWSTPGFSQAPPADKSTASSAQAEAGDPRADTSGRNSAPAAPTPGAAVPAGTRNAAEPAARGTSRTTPRTSAAGRTPGATDKVDLGTATVTGDREQPKVMYIVPWKRADVGDLSGKPMNSLLDEALAPVDRDEFKREVAYYGAVKTDADQKVEK